MTNRPATIKKIPYGLADYEKIVKGNYYYVDKTMYLKSIEEAGDYLFFIRPRRFGKSLFLSVIETYYDISKKDQFDFFYKDTSIHEQPTGEKSNYLILKFNFSAVEPHPQKIESSFLNNVKTRIMSFLIKYADYLDINIREELQTELKRMSSAADLLLRVANLCEISNQKLYVIIDEYDNFANTILSTSGSKEYKDLTHGEGFFKAFFNILKDSATGSGAPLSRLFITGVSPVTMDDVTSGFNIGKNISIEPGFNEMLGFTREDVMTLIEYYRENDALQHPTEDLVEIMKTWYNNYLFSKKSKTKLYNSDMVLYFIDKCIRTQDIPDELIDRNVRIDYGKLKHLIIIDSDQGKLTNGNFSRLKEIIEKGEIQAGRIAEGFPVDKLTDTKNFISLLFYLGLLTVKEEKDGEPVLWIPNETARRLYYDYISEAYEETGTFSMDWYVYGRLMHDAAYGGKWKPLFEYIARQMNKSMSLRDLIEGENSVRAFLNVYLGLSQLYIIHTEKESNNGYADIVMEPFIARYPEIKYVYMLEIKYIKQKEKDKDKKLDSLVKQAEKQLEKYSLDEKFKKTIGNKTLINLVLVFSGTNLEYIQEIKEKSR